MTDYKDEYLCEMKRADAAEDALTALREELDELRAATAWRPGTLRPPRDGLYLTDHNGTVDVNRHGATGWHCARIPTRWLPIPPIGDGR